MEHIKDSIKKHRKSQVVSGCLLVVKILCTLTAPFLFKLLIDRVLINKESDFYLMGFMAFLCVSIMAAVMEVASKNKLSKLSLEWATDMKQDLVEKFLKNSYSDFIKIKISDWLQSVFEDVDAIKGLIAIRPVLYRANLLMVIAIFIGLLAYNPYIAILLFPVIPITTLIYKWARPKLETCGSLFKEKRSACADQVKEATDAILPIKLNTSEDYFAAKYALASGALKEVTVKYKSVGDFMSFSVDLLSTAFQVGYMVLGTWLSIKYKWMSLGDIFAFSAYIMVLCQMTKEILQQKADLARFNHQISRVESYLQMPAASIFSKGSAQTNSIGTVRVSDLGFRYEDKWVFRNLNFQLEKGKPLLIHGETGKGKTTLLKAILGFNEPEEGSIEWGDKHTTCEERQSSVAYVEQNPILLNMSLLENLKIANPRATLEACERVCKQIGLHEEILNMPEGYHTLIGHKGARLSGGQKQRLIIARAMLSNRDLIVFDEPTANLDEGNESKFLELLKTLLQDKLVIVISHRQQVKWHLQENILEL